MGPICCLCSSCWLHAAFQQATLLPMAAATCCLAFSGGGFCNKVLVEAATGMNEVAAEAASVVATPNFWMLTYNLLLHPCTWLVLSKEGMFHFRRCWCVSSKAGTFSGQLACWGLCIRVRHGVRLDSGPSLSWGCGRGDEKVGSKGH